MSKARVRRVKKIGNYRVFEGWSDEGRPREFQRVNLVYGQNGSGKSTLVNLFHACSMAESLTPSPGLELDVEMGTLRSTVTEDDAHFWPRVRVFNAEYVRQNLRFDDTEGPSPESLLTLSKPNVDAEAKLKTATESLGIAQPQLVPAQQAVSTATTQLEKRLTATASAVVDDLRDSTITTYRATNTYNKSKVRTLLNGDPAVFESASTDIPTDRATALSKTMPTPEFAPRSALSSSEAVKSARKFLKTNVVVEVIESLRGHADRAEWVQQGIPLHDDLNTCLFCGEPLTDRRRHELTAHFDTSLTTLQFEIDQLTDSLQKSIEASQYYLDKIPADGTIYQELSSELQAARANYRDAHNTYTEQIECLIDKLASKRSNPFQKPELAEDFKLAVPTTSEVDAVITKHGNKSESHNTEVAAAARRVELARVKELEQEYADRKADIAAKQKVASDLEDEIGQLQQVIVALQNVSADPVPSAAELTKNVARLLGRADLEFSSTSDGKHYMIQRDGQPAKNLSEGERTAIALLHFLIGGRKDVTPGDEPIVVIDDPVSSLDDAILFGASSYLWSELVTSTFASQVFLLTHNFELFRQWIVALENAGNAVADGYTIHEVSARYREYRGTIKRLPRIDPWTDNDKLSRRLRSQYHFLFARVADAVIEASPGLGIAEQMNVLALVPNAARKMMESFLSFRFPDKMGNFHGGIVAALGRVQDQSIRTHVERYLHAYSHNEEGNISASVDPSEATAVLRSLFQMMKVVDGEHFTAMCKALKIDESVLLTPPTGSSLNSV